VLLKDLFPLFTLFPVSRPSVGGIVFCLPSNDCEQKYSSEIRVCCISAQPCMFLRKINDCHCLQCRCRTILCLKWGSIGENHVDV
jgi:hypothetical protein